MSKRKPDPKTQNRSARLMAVQGVYALLVDQKPPAEITLGFLQHYQNMEIDGDTLEKPNEALFRTIIDGVATQGAELNTLFNEYTSGMENQNRVPLLKALILCGLFEVKNNYHIDIAIIINDYLHVAHAFFDQNEPKLVHAILDRFVKSVQTP